MTQTRGKRGRTLGVGDTWKIKDELPVFKELNEGCGGESTVKHLKSQQMKSR